MSSPTLRITETFYSLQGESNLVGLPTLFIRLTGCPLRCQYCDTEYAFYGGEQIAIAALVEQAQQQQAQNICVTGGEPLAQPECLTLLTTLCDAGFNVSLETSGAMSLAAVDSRVIKVMDLKTPGSAEVEKNDWSNLQNLQTTDQIKFVICSREDYDWAKSKLIEFDLTTKVAEILFSPSAQQLPAKQLAQWILEDNLPVRFQLQVHRIIWGDTPGV